MFTGIVEAVGTVVENAPGSAGRRGAVPPPRAAPTPTGRAGRVNGACGPAPGPRRGRFTAGLVGREDTRAARGGA